MQRTKPPFRADHVGSLLRPAAAQGGAREARQGRDHAPPSSRRSRTARSNALIRKQEEVGLKSVTDGEYRRSWWHLDFLWGLDGVERHVDGLRASRSRACTTRNEGVRVTGKLGSASIR